MNRPRSSLQPQPQASPDLKTNSGGRWIKIKDDHGFISHERQCTFALGLKRSSSSVPAAVGLMTSSSRSSILISSCPYLPLVGALLGPRWAWHGGDSGAHRCSFSLVATVRVLQPTPFPSSLCSMSMHGGGWAYRACCEEHCAVGAHSMHSTHGVSFDDDGRYTGGIFSLAQSCPIPLLAP